MERLQSGGKEDLVSTVFSALSLSYTHTLASQFAGSFLCFASSSFNALWMLTVFVQERGSIFYKNFIVFTVLSVAE